MDTSKVYRIVKDLHNKIQTSSLQAHFNTITQNLTKLGQQMTQQARQQALNQIENERREISTAINTFIPSSLSVEDTKIYETLGAYALFGYDGQQRLNEIFTSLQTNPANIRPLLQHYQQEITKISNIYSSLFPFEQNLISRDEQLENRNLIILFFQSEAEINNLDELAKVSNKWNHVLIAFALLAKENDRAFRIEAVERGSIILTLSAIAGIVIAFGTAANKVLDVIKKYYEIKKLAFDAKQLKGGIPEKTVQDLEASSKIKLKTETNEITSQLIEEYGWNQEDQRKDVDVAVRMAVRHLLEFVNKGGKVDIKLLVQSEEKKEVEMNLTIKYNEIKQIEKKMAHGDGQKQMLELTEGELEEEDTISKDLQNEKI